MGKKRMSGVRERYHNSLQEQDNHDKQSSFRFRMLLAMILFAILILFDKSNSKTAETAIENFSKAISADVEDKLEIWVEKNIK